MTAVSRPRACRTRPGFSAMRRRLRSPAQRASDAVSTRLIALGRVDHQGFCQLLDGVVRPNGLDLTSGITWSAPRLRDADSGLAQLADWIDDYTTEAPRSALGMRSPAEYRAEQLTLRSSR